MEYHKKEADNNCTGANYRYTLDANYSCPKLIPNGVGQEITLQIWFRFSKIKAPIRFTFTVLKHSFNHRYTSFYHCLSTELTATTLPN